MFTIDIYNNPTPLSIYLAKADKTILGCLDNIIDQSTASLSIHLNRQYELSFEVTNNDDISNWYSYIHEGMYLYVDHVGFFKMIHPEILNDENKSRKSVKAYSIDSELEDKNIDLSINTGKKTSMEYLVEYDSDETDELVNPYTGIPYDWIVLYNTFPEQLTEFLALLRNGHFGAENANGDIVVSDAEKVQEITDITTLIPRLKNRAIYFDNEDGTKDTNFVEYIIPQYNGETSRNVEFTLPLNRYSYTISIAQIDNCIGVSYVPVTCDLRISYAYVHDGETSHRVCSKRINSPTIQETINRSNGQITSYDYTYVLSDNIYDYQNMLMSAVWYATGISDLENVTIENVYAVTSYKYSYSLTEGNVVSSYILTDLLDGRINYLIQFYTKYRNQLSMLPIILENTGWTVGDIYGVENGDYSLANKKYQFEANETVYSFLTQSLSSSAECIVTFDLLNRKVNLTPVSEIGSDTGIVLGYDNLVNSLKINTEEDRLATRLYVTGGDDLGITRVNFGSPYVEDLGYKMNAVNEDGDKIYVSDSLSEKYNAFKEFREQQREEYITLSKQYETYAAEISEIENRVPNDELSNDWSTFTIDELKAMLTHYKNLLATLKTLYKNEYGDAGLNIDGSIKESYIKTTPYWWDYCAYNSLIDEVTCAIVVYPNYNDQSYWTDEQITLYRNKIKEWETNWSLFGTIELQAKIDTYKQNMDLMLEEQEGVGSGESASIVIRKNSSGYEIKTWNELTTAEKSSYGNTSLLYRYDDYMVYYNNVLSAQAYLETLQTQIDSLKQLQNDIQSQRVAITQSVQYDSYFTADECNTIYRLLRDSDYENENIITTSIDSTSRKIDIMRELLEDAKDKVSETSRPQLVFSVEADNLLGLSEFEPFWDSFNPGNYVLVQYRDKTYVRLRMIGFTFNPCLPSSNSLSIEFSNFTRSRSDYNDWGYLLGNGSGSGGRNSSSGNDGSGGYGESDDIDVTLSNTMLAKLLNSETFGTRVTDIILDTIDVNKITARLATFGGLAQGTTWIDGKCITTGYIKDINYNGLNGGVDNTEGSILNLDTGLFNFGGGRFKYDGVTLSVDGHVKAISLSTGNKTSNLTGQTGLYIDSSGNLYAGSNNEVQIGSSGTLTLGTDKLVFNGSSLSVKGAVSATSLSAGNKTSSATGQTGLYIDSNGNLYAGSNNQTQINSDGTFNLAYGKLVYNGSTLTIDGTVKIGNITLNGLVSDVNDAASDASSAYSYASSAYSAASNAAKTATNFLSVTNSGLVITSSSTNGRCIITSGGMDVYDGSTQIASFGSSIRLGEANSYNMYISGSTVHFRNSSTDRGKIDLNDGGYNLTYRSYGSGVFRTDGDMQIYSGGSTEASSSGGALHIWAGSGGVKIDSAGCGLVLRREVSSNGNGIFRPDGDQSVVSGTSSNRWAAVYCINSNNSTSDRKEKDVTGSISFAHDLIMGLNPVDFYWKHGDHRRTRMGFIAQDVASWCNSRDLNLALYSASYKDDELVPYYGEDVDDNELTWGMCYEQLIAPMVKVIQEQQSEIDQLKEAVNELYSN